MKWHPLASITMPIVLTINLVWSIVMLAAFTLLYVGAPDAPREMLLVLGLANATLAAVARRRNRWGIAGSVAVAALAALRWVPMAVYNWRMFFDGHKLYSDSPGTIIIVAVYSLLFAIPATVLLVGYALNSRALLLLFVRHQ
jgi:hypothetical protein